MGGGTVKVDSPKRRGGLGGKPMTQIFFYSRVINIYYGKLFYKNVKEFSKIRLLIFI